MNKKSNKFIIPVVLFTFRRLDTVKMIMEEIRKIQPQTMYIFSDGHREGNKEEEKKVLEVREYLQKAVTWDCDLTFEFAEKNMGCANRITSGIDMVFSKEDKAIIFEDDAVPSQEFFFYCRELLERYETDRRIQYICGFNFIGDIPCIEHSYTYTFFGGLSGAFATWANRWNECDFEMKSWPHVKKTSEFRRKFYFKELFNVYKSALEDSYLQKNDGWDYQFQYDGMYQNRFGIVPKGNLVESYGYVEGAFHVQEKGIAKRLKRMMKLSEERVVEPFTYPLEVKLDEKYDKVRQRVALDVTGNYFERHYRYLKIALKDFIYPFYAKIFKLKL